MRNIKLKRYQIFILAAVIASLCVSFFEIGRKFAPKVEDLSSAKVWGPDRASPSSSGGADTWLEDYNRQDRYLNYVSLDKPIYRPGDTLFARAPALHALDLTPLANSRYHSYNVYAVGPKGETHSVSQWVSGDGAASVAWVLPPDLPGGEYKLRYEETAGTFPPAERKFTVKALRTTRFRLSLEFASDGYGFGDEASATFQALSSDGGPLNDATAVAVARIDGQEVYRSESLEVPLSGEIMITVPLPSTWEEGVGTLTVTVTKGGDTEAVSRTLPLLTSSVDIQVYPEGGDLVVGLPTRVYFEARNPWNDPADVVGKICPVQGAAAACVADIATIHEGRGVSTVFVPEAHVKYELRISSPSNVKAVTYLPPAKEVGASLRAMEQSYPADAPIKFQVSSTLTGQHRLSLYRREVELSAVQFKILTPNTPMGVHLTAPSTASSDGVLRATLYNSHGVPLAERLIFRDPSRKITLKIETDQQQYSPGNPVSLTLFATHADGSPAKNVNVGITVTDSRVDAELRRRDKQPRLPEMVLLEDEVLDLHDALSYLDDSNATGPSSEKLDLLLGTQGWRRFVYMDVGSFLKNGTVLKDLPLNKDGEKEAVDEQVRKRLVGVGKKPEMMFKNAHFAARAGVQPMMAMAPNGFEEDAMIPEAAFFDEGVQGEALAAGGMAFQGVQEDAMDYAEMEVEVFDDDDEGDLAAGKAMDWDILPQGGAEFDLDPMATRVGRPAQIWTGEKVYAHQKPRNAKVKPEDDSGARNDFTETVYFAGALVTGSDGSVTSRFTLSDMITAFRVEADGYSKGGVLGKADYEFLSSKPVVIDIKIPTQVTNGDRIFAPVTVSLEHTDDNLRGSKPNSVSVTLQKSDGLEVGEIDGLGLAQNEDGYLSTELHFGDANYDTSFYLPLQVSLPVGPEQDKSQVPTIALSASVPNQASEDSLTKKLKVNPRGFPASANIGGLLKIGESGKRSLEFTLPEDMVEGSFTLDVSVYPSPVASLTEAVSALIQEPCGCFEQTSATTYPMVMALQYLTNRRQKQGRTKRDTTVQNLINKAINYLSSGYQKLLSFESKTGGFEWFGDSPGHEALSAYAVLQFTEMSQVMPVDREMLRRTQDWLMSRKDGKGGFLASSQALDSFGRAPQLITDAYIVYSLLEAGFSNLDHEITALVAKCDSTEFEEDTYTLALTSASLYMSNQRVKARSLAKRVVAQQAEDGNVQGAQGTITCSSGASRLTENTAVAVIAWLKDTSGEFTGNIEKAIRWLAAQCKKGRFGGTQSTILSLKAILMYEASRTKHRTPLEVAVIVDEAIPITATVPVTAQDTIKIPFSKGQAPHQLLAATKSHSVTVSLDFPETMMKVGMHGSDEKNQQELPFSATASWRSLTPVTDSESPLSLSATLSATSISEGEPVDVCVAVTNKAADSQSMVVAVIGIPGGIELRSERFKELKEEHKIAFSQMNGQDLELYWYGMGPNQTNELCFDGIAALPGEYTGQASRTYIYYGDEAKTWIDPLEISIETRTV